MTRAEAQAEAVRRWGHYGRAWILEISGDYAVGKFNAWFGRGDSWESAFADADARTKPENQTKTNKGG